MTPMARSLKLLRQQGYEAGAVERYIAALEVHQDLFGALDIVAAHPAVPGILGVQTTTRAHMAERLHKVRTSGAIGIWLAAGGRVEVHGWYRRGECWEVHRVEVKSKDVTVITPRRRPRRQRKGERQRGLFDNGQGLGRGV